MSDRIADIWGDRTPHARDTSWHPLAGATTLILSLGLLTSTGELLAIAAGVILVTALAVALNRVLGVRQPF